MCVWVCVQAAERSVVYCFLGRGIISALFSRFLKWPERLWVLQRQKVLMAETWSFSSGCLIISQLSPNCSNPIKTHATATNQIIPGLNLHNWSPSLFLISESASVSLSIFIFSLSLILQDILDQGFPNFSCHGHPNMTNPLRTLSKMHIHFL